MGAALSEEAPDADDASDLAKLIARLKAADHVDSWSALVCQSIKRTKGESLLIPDVATAETLLLGILGRADHEMQGSDNPPLTRRSVADYAQSFEAEIGWLTENLPDAKTQVMPVAARCREVLTRFVESDANDAAAEYSLEKCAASVLKQLRFEAEPATLQEFARLHLGCTMDRPEGRDFLALILTVLGFLW